VIRANSPVKAMPLRSALLLATLPLLFSHPGSCLAQAVPTGIKAQSPKTPPAAAAAPAAQPRQVAFAAVDQAKKAGVKACAPLLEELVKQNVDAEHAAITTWNKQAPDQRMYSALNVMKFPNEVAPRAIGVVTTTPAAGGHCDGDAVRIHPSKLACEDIAKSLSKAPAPQTIGDVKVYPPNNAGQRVILLPAATSGCVVIGTGAYYGL
jgi:hypothetical protein